MWIFIGLATLAIAAALGALLPALLRKPREHDSERRALNIAVYRDQLKDLEAERDNGALAPDQFEQAKLELEDRLAEDALSAEIAQPSTDRGGRWVGWAIAGLLPALAIGIYAWRGAPDLAFNPAMAQAQPADPHGSAASMAQIEAELAKLKTATETNPKDAAAWFKLGLANMAMERFPVALEALKRASELAPKEAEIWAHYAEATAMTNNRDLEGEPMRLVRQALDLNPLQPKALELAGIHAYQNGNWTQAAYYWKSLLKQMSEEERQSGYGKEIAAAERDARGKSEAALAAPAKPSAKKAGAGNGSISGRIELAPALKAKIKAGDALYLFARGNQNGQPLAALKARAEALPLDFVLDDSMTMSPEMALSKASEVVLVARIARSGQPKAAPGDLEGSKSGVKPGAKGVILIIDRIVP